MSGKQKLKIGVVVDQLIAGGVQLAAIQQVKQLRVLGHDACLLVLMRKKYPSDYSYLVKGIQHQYLSDFYPWPFRHTIKFPIFSFLSTLHVLGPFFAPKVVKKNDYDILIGHGTTTCLTTQALWRKRKIPYLAVIHDPMVYILEKCYSDTFLRFFFPILKPLAKLFEQSFVKDAQQTLIDSEVHSPYILKNYGVKAVVLTLGCQPLDKLPPRRGNNLLTFGRWQKEKNVGFLLKLLKVLPKTNLVVAGTWIKEEDLRDFKQQIKRQELQDRVKIVTKFNSRQLENLCRQARVWIHAHFEAFGLGALEAASFGLPVIIPAGSGVTELLRDGLDGFFPKKITISDYKKLLTPLLNDERLAYKMGKNAWQQIRNEYSWSAHIKKLVDLIQGSLRTLNLPKITAIEIGHAGGTGLSGGDKLLEEMTKRMADKFNLEVITSSFGSQHWLASGLAVKTTVLTPNPFESGSGPFSVFLSYAIRMIQTTIALLATKPSPEILYSSTNILPDVLPVFLAKVLKPKTPWVARIHHLIPLPHKREGRITVNVVSYLMQIVALFSMKTKADLTIALNETLFNNLIKIGFSRDRLTTLGAGIDFPYISQYQPQRLDDVDAVFLGRLHVTKDIFCTIEIWQEVTHQIKKATLAIIGEGPKEIEEDLKKQIKQVGLAKNVKVLGYLPQPRVLDYLKSAKVFLFADHEAGWGLAIAEAMACRLPVVGYDIGVLGDVFKKGYIKIPCFNKKSFAEAIINLLENRKRRAKLSNEAFSQAKNLSWEKTTQKFVDTISSLS